MPWQSGRCLICGAPVVDSLTSSHTPTTSVTPCGAAEAAALRKRAKYAAIMQSNCFVPNRHQEPGINHYGWSALPRQPRRTPLVSFRRSKRHHIHVPKNFCSDSNFQFGSCSWFVPRRDSDRTLPL